MAWETKIQVPTSPPGTPDYVLNLRYATSQLLLFLSQLSLIFTFNSARGHPVNLCMCLLQIHQSDCRSQLSRVVFIQPPSVSPGQTMPKKRTGFHNTTQLQLQPPGRACYRPCCRCFKQVKSLCLPLYLSGRVDLSKI